jgi:hypothetical protein
MLYEILSNLPEGKGTIHLPIDQFLGSFFLFFEQRSIMDVRIWLQHPTIPSLSGFVYISSLYDTSIVPVVFLVERWETRHYSAGREEQCSSKALFIVYPSNIHSQWIRRHSYSTLLRFQLQTSLSGQSHRYAPILLPTLSVISC